MDDGKSKLSEFRMPQEEMLEVGRQKSKLTIGVPKEVLYDDNRIPLVPDGVALLTRHGHHVIIEAGAGTAAHFSDHEYSEAGAQIVYSPNEVYTSDLVLKVPPFTQAEIERVKPKQTLISSLQMGMQREEYFRGLSSRKVNALAFELIRDHAHTFPLVRAMSEIAGSMSAFIAAEFLGHEKFGKGKMFGGYTGIPPTEVVIIGAGTVGEYAARSALGLGATVRVFDSAVYRLRRLQTNLGRRVFTSILQPNVLLEAMHSADVLIGAIHAREGRAPCLVTETMVRAMKEGSVIIDVSIDQGGCFETSRPTTHADPVFQLHGVTHYCVPNIPSRVPYTASQALNNVLIPVVLNIAEGGGIDHAIKDDWAVRHGVYLYNGIVTSPLVSKYFNLPSQDIDLLLTGLH